MGVFVAFHDKWAIFKEKYGLNQEIQKITTYLDMRIVQDNLCLFAPGVSISFDRACFSGAINTNKDRILELITRFEKEKEIYREACEALKEFSFDEYIVLIKRFLLGVPEEKLRLAKKNPFIIEDIIVSFASKDNDYLYQNSILDRYTELKKEHLSLFEKLIKSIQENLEQEIEPYREIYPLKTNFLAYNKRTGAYRRKSTICSIWIALMKKQIPKEEVYRFLPMYIGGKQMMKFI